MASPGYHGPSPKPPNPGIRHQHSCSSSHSNAAAFAGHRLHRSSQRLFPAKNRPFWYIHQPIPETEEKRIWGPKWSRQNWLVTDINTHHSLESQAELVIGMEKCHVDPKIHVEKEHNIGNNDIVDLLKTRNCIVHAFHCLPAQ